jgi:hypothetical protein
MILCLFNDVFQLRWLCSIDDMMVSEKKISWMQKNTAVTYSAVLSLRLSFGTQNKHKNSQSGQPSFGPWIKLGLPTYVQWSVDLTFFTNDIIQSTSEGYSAVMVAWNKGSESREQRGEEHRLVSTNTASTK